MQVIFIKDLKKQGKKGEIKTVKDGYAENFLIKNGYAVPVNQHNLNDLKSTKEREKKLDLENRKNAEIESLGYHDVSINLYADVNAKVKVHVVK